MDRWGEEGLLANLEQQARVRGAYFTQRNGSKFLPSLPVENSERVDN